MITRHHLCTVSAALLLTLPAIAQGPPPPPPPPPLAGGLAFRPSPAGPRLDLRNIPTDQLRVLQENQVTGVRPDLQQILLKPNQLVARRLPKDAERTTSAEGKVRWTLPYQIAGVDAHGKALDLRTIIEVDGGGMRPEDTGGFLGRIFAEVLDTKAPDSSRPLSPAIQILVTGEVDDIQPQTLSFDHTNDFVQVDLRAASPNDPVKVRLLPSFDTKGSEIELPVLRGQLHISASPDKIQGLGLETTVLTIRVTGGPPNPQGLGVILTSREGSLEENQLSLDRNGIASTTLRSVTTGVDTVHAESATLDSAETEVQFVFPWLFFASALLGGAVGALIRWGRNTPSARRKLHAEILLGTLAGLLVACAYSIGINLVGFKPAAHAGEALVFVLAGLGAVFGLPRREASDDGS